MNILFLFEESGTGRDYAIDQGHHAVSVDLLPGRGRHIGQHWQYDVYQLLDGFNEFEFDFWDIVIMHPDCRRVCVSGNRYHAGTQGRIDDIRQDEKLWGYPFRCVCLEQPVTVLPTQSEIFGKADRQTVQPYHHGHTEQKTTILYRRGLPALIETDNVYDEMMKLPLKERTKVHYASPGPNRSRDRSKSYDGIIRAMIDQWA